MTTQDSTTKRWTQTHLGVDSGQMAVVPELLVHRGNFAEIDAAIDAARADGGVHLAGSLGIAFRLDTPLTVYLGVDLNNFDQPMTMRVQTTPTGLRNRTTRVTLPAGVYVLGDPCYTVDTEDDQRRAYYRICEALMPGFQAAHPVIAYHFAAVANVDGQKVLVCSTGGDGVFYALLHTNLFDGLSIQVGFETADEDYEDEADDE